MGALHDSCFRICTAYQRTGDYPRAEGWRNLPCCMGRGRAVHWSRSLFLGGGGHVGAGGRVSTRFVPRSDSLLVGAASFVRRETLDCRTRRPGAIA